MHPAINYKEEMETFSITLNTICSHPPFAVNSSHVSLQRYSSVVRMQCLSATGCSNQEIWPQIATKPWRSQGDFRPGTSSFPNVFHIKILRTKKITGWGRGQRTMHSLLISLEEGQTIICAFHLPSTYSFDTEDHISPPDFTSQFGQIVGVVGAGLFVKCDWSCRLTYCVNLAWITRSGRISLGDL